MTWTKAEITELRKLWRNIKFSASAIGRALGKSRDSVLGKIHRLGLHNRRPQNSHKVPRRHRIFHDKRNEIDDCDEYSLGVQ